jgi:DNA-directed RNA polymerase specialized sigma24 family protein
MLGIEPATLRQRLARARARLLATLERLPRAAGEPKKTMP